MLSKGDTRYVACADPAERERVRKSFLEKKLGLTAAELRRGDRGRLRSDEGGPNQVTVDVLLSAGRAVWEA